MKAKFEEQLAVVLRRAARLKAAVEGSADISYVKVASCKVSAHTRGAHTRAVITMRKKQRPALKLIHGGK